MGELDSGWATYVSEEVALWTLTRRIKILIFLSKAH
jgi:hypothetical protein